MSRYALLFEAQHFAMYADSGRTYGRRSLSAKALWDDRIYEVWTLLDGTADPPRYLRENLSLFELGNRFVMVARDIADNYRRLGPPNSNLSDTRGFRFIRDEVVPELLPGYFRVAENIIQGCVADQRLLNSVLLSLLVVEACCLCGAAVLYLLYRLVRVSKYQTSLFSVFLAIPSATVRTLTLRKLEEGEDDDDADADAEEEDLDAEEANAPAAGGQGEADPAYSKAGYRLTAATADVAARLGSRANLARSLSRSLTARRRLGPVATGSGGNWGVARSGPSRLGAGADAFAVAQSPRAAGLRPAAFSIGRGAEQQFPAAKALGSVTNSPGAAAGRDTASDTANLPQTPILQAGVTRAAAYSNALPLVLRSTRGKSISFRDHAPPGAASEDGHGSDGPLAAAASGTEWGASGRRQQPGRAGSSVPVNAHRASGNGATGVQAQGPQSLSGLTGAHSSPSTAAPSPDEGGPGPAGVSDGSLVDDDDVLVELNGAAGSRQRRAMPGVLGSKRLGKAMHATVSGGRSLGQRALAAAATGQRRVSRFTRQLLKRRSVMTGTNKILIANSLKDCWRLLPIIVWAILVISLYAYTYTISDWAMTPLDTVTITSFTIARNVRMIYFAHELCANNSIDAIAASKAQLNRTTALVARDYATMLFGQRYEAPEAADPSTALSDAGYQVQAGRAGIARLGGRVGDILYKGLNPDGSGGNCLRPNASNCFQIGHPYAVPSLNGLDVAFRHSFEAAGALVGASNEQINIGNRFLDFLFKVTSNDVHSALLSLREYFNQQLHDAMSTWQAAHIGLYIATVVLFVLFLISFVRPFVRSTRDEAEHVANMLSDLPPEVDIIRLVEAALGVGDGGKAETGTAAGGKGTDVSGDTAGAQKDAAHKRAAAAQTGSLSSWLEKAGMA